MAQSPLDTVGRAGARSYLDGWDALASMIVRGRSFSGHERNVCLLNTGTAEGAPRFADVSAATGFDLPDDGRALAATDWDGDGDLDIWTTNRGAPRVRLLKNHRNDGGRAGADWVALDLEGTRGNRDAIGARLELTLGGTTQVRCLTAGDGFLSQSGKRLHFGLGRAGDATREADGEPPAATLVVRWPGGGRETFARIVPGAVHRIVEGTGTAERRMPPSSPADLETAATPPPPPDDRSRIFLAEPRAAPAVEYATFEGERRRLAPDRGPVLVNLWATWCAPCREELAMLAAHAGRLTGLGVRILALSVDGVTGDAKEPDLSAARQLARESSFPFECGATDTASVGRLTALVHGLLALERPLAIPSSFLIDESGAVAAVYGGPVDIERLLADVGLLDAPRAARLLAALPFPGRDGDRFFPFGDLDLARAWTESGHPEEARALAHRALAAATEARDRAGQGQAWMFLGNLELGNGDAAAAVEAFAAAASLAPDEPRIAIPLAAARWRAGHRDAAESAFRDLAERFDGDPAVLQMLARAQRELGLPEPAAARLERAATLDPDDLSIAFDHAVALGEAGRAAEAVARYRDIVARHPSALDARNNLAWLLATHPDPAIRDPEAALTHARQVDEATGSADPATLDTLAAALAATGDFEGAGDATERAIALARATGRHDLLPDLRARLERYRAARPTSP